MRREAQTPRPVHGWSSCGGSWAPWRRRKSVRRTMRRTRTTGRCRSCRGAAPRATATRRPPTQPPCCSRWTGELSSGHGKVLCCRGGVEEHGKMRNPQPSPRMPAPAVFHTANSHLLHLPLRLSPAWRGGCLDWSTGWKGWTRGPRKCCRPAQAAGWARCRCVGLAAAAAVLLMCTPGGRLWLPAHIRVALLGGIEACSW